MWQQATAIQYMPIQGFRLTTAIPLSQATRLVYLRDLTYMEWFPISGLIGIYTVLSNKFACKMQYYDNGVGDGIFYRMLET